MKVLIIIAILVVIAGFLVKEYQYSPFLLGEKYQNMSAADKLDKIRTLIKKTSGSRSSWPHNLRLFQIMVQDNEKSFMGDQDDMPHGMLGFTRREKILHEVGLTAEFEFKSNNKHNFTGIFKGVEHGILRMSAAFTPQSGLVIPNFAFKFLRSGVKSANLLTMYGITGQKDYNVLQHDQTTHFPNINDEAELNFKLLRNTFQKVSDWANDLGFHEAATYDTEGKKEANPEFPFRVAFHPTKEARNANKNEGEISKYMHVEQLFGKQFSTLFEVYAQTTPFSEDVIHIGSIHMKTPFVTSEFGDHHLYYSHVKFEEDLAIKPEWEDPAENINDRQSKIVPQYFYPDIQD